MIGHPLLHEDAIPFSLLLERHGGELECLSSLRIRPGKRVTCLASRDNNLVVAKIFHATQSGLRHWKEDIAGLQALHDADILAPTVRLWDSDASLDLAFLITEFLHHGVTFLEAWQEQRRPERRQAMLRQLLRILARQHLAGLLHTDPHLRNFMFDNNQVVTIDGGDIRVLGDTPDQQQCIDNLGLLLAQFPPTEPAISDGCLHHYLDAMGWGAHTELLQRIHVATRRSRDRRWQKYSRKIFRECSAFVAQRSARHRMVCRREHFEGEVREFLRSPEDFLGSSRARSLKDGNSSSVYAIELDGRPRVVKRYNIKSASHALRRALQPTRAARSWRNSLGLEFHGIPTASPVAFLERRFGPLRSRAYLVMEQLTGPTLADYLKDVPTLDIPVVNQAATLLRQLQTLHIGHGDMKASNFIVTGEGIAIVDLDSMRFFRSEETYRGARATDRRRFLENWAQQPRLHQRFDDLIDV